METRLTNLYVPLHACLPQMLVKLWHKSSYGPVRQIEKGCHVIGGGGGGWHAIQFLRTFVSMGMNHYVTLHASLPQILRGILGESEAKLEINFRRPRYFFVRW